MQGKNAVKKDGKAAVSYKKTVLIVTAAVMALIIIALSVLGISSALRRSRYLVSYGNLGVSEGVVAYFSASYKSDYIQKLVKNGVEARDSEEFWNSEAELGVTYGDMLKEATLDYIKGVLITASLFDKYSSVSASDRETIEKGKKEVLTYRANGSVETFNEKTKIYGFNYSDFEIGTALLYKSSRAMERIFGTDGSSAVLFSELCEEFLGGYSRVFLIFVRDEEVFELDEEGNRVKGEDGNDKLRPMTDEEKAQRVQRLELIRSCMAGLNDDTVAPERYFELQQNYDEGDKEFHTGGYYFKDGTSYTKDFATAFPTVIDAALSVSIGNCVEVETSIGSCFVYRCDVESGAYLEEDDGPFSDFFAKCASFIYGKLLNEAKGGVAVKETRWDAFDVVAVPYSKEFYVRY